ncbi:adenylosuccinate synthase [bacterium]|nr:MAG: adenylosuccinate synthase [bacterium]
MVEKNNKLVVGLFWGDEGKAKIVDFLTPYAEVVVRYQGGANAGHSVEVAGQRFVLHQVPTGILHPDKKCVLGAGMVIDLPQLVEELSELESRGIEWRGRIMVSPRAHLVLPYHKLIEEIQEAKRSIGTTRRGIGPAYRDKAARIGIRVGEVKLGKAHLIKKLGIWLKEVGELYEKTAGVSFPSPESVANELVSSAELLADSITEASAYLYEVAKRGGILAEGAQGTMLSLNWGTYPFVTSSETTAGGASEGLGIDLRMFDSIIGVAKAFCTRVGNGPFPTEADEETQKLLRGTGENLYDEFGSTTGRPRRCGWFDSVILRYSTRINGVQEIALTKLDVLSGIEPLKVAVNYRDYGDELPVTAEEMETVEPIYEELPGWSMDISAVRKFEELPENAKNYIRFLEKIAGVPIRYIGVGPGRDDIIVRGEK